MCCECGCSCECDKKATGRDVCRMCECALCRRMTQFGWESRSICGENVLYPWRFQMFWDLVFFFLFYLKWKCYNNATHVLACSLYSGPWITFIAFSGDSQYVTLSPLWMVMVVTQPETGTRWQTHNNYTRMVIALARPFSSADTYSSSGYVRMGPLGGMYCRSRTQPGFWCMIQKHFQHSKANKRADFRNVFWKMEPCNIGLQ